MADAFGNQGLTAINRAMIISTVPMIIVKWFTDQIL
jgi:hypothetical protein